MADYLILQQREINAQNESIDSYNSKLEAVLNGAKLYADFETILDERKSILMIDGNLSDEHAERQITDFENIYSVVLSL